MGSMVEDLARSLRVLDGERQRNVIRRVEERDEAAPEFLRKIRRMQKHREKIQDLAGPIANRFS